MVKLEYHPRLVSARRRSDLPTMRERLFRVRTHHGMLIAAAFQAAATLAYPAAAQTANPSSNGIETVTVIGTTPLPGTGIDIDKVAGNVQTVSAADLTTEGSARATP